MKDRLDFLGRAAVFLFEPSLVGIEIGLIAIGQIGLDQVVLALEVVVERAFGDACLLGHCVDADRAYALAVEEPVGGGDDTFAGRQSFHEIYVYRLVSIHNGSIRELSRKMRERLPC